MSETVSPRAGAFVGPSARADRARPVPIGYGLLIAAALSLGLWTGVGLAMARIWF